MADDMREADETDDDEEATEREDNHNDSESWEGLSAENEEEEESLNQEEVVNEQEEKEKEDMKEPEVQPRVPELIFQDGQWVQSSDAWSDFKKNQNTELEIKNTNILETSLVNILRIMPYSLKFVSGIKHKQDI